MTSDYTDDPNQHFFSIHVPNTANTATNHYLRLGTADSTREGGLPADPNDPSGQTNTQAGASLPDGISLFTTGSYTLSAPSVNSWSSDSLTAVVNGNDLYTASYTTGPNNGMRPATVTYQNVDQMTNTAAASTNFLNGDALTYWNGNDQSLGIGGLLWANYGLTTNLFGGCILNLTNSSAELQGFGSYKVEQTAGITASDSINFSVTPFTKGFDANVRVIKALSVVMAVLTLFTTTMDAIMTGQLRAVNMSPDATSDTQESSLKNAMQDLYKEQITATSLVTLIQAMSIVVAIMIKVFQAAEKKAALVSGSSIAMDDTSITLSVGLSKIKITLDGITMYGPRSIIRPLLL